MSEGSGALWRYVRDKLLPRDIHATRVENGISAGFPDVHYTVRHETGISHTGALELKFLRKKNPPFGEEGLNRDQMIWIREELALGGSVWIVADIGKHICMIRGKFAPVFNGWGRAEFMRNSTVILEKRKLTKDRVKEFQLFL